MHLVRLLLLGLLITNCSSMFSQTRAIETHLAVVSSPDVPSLTKQQLGSCLQQLLREWKLNERDLPDIVVFHVSKKTASTAAVEDKISVRKNRIAGEPTGYFEVWLVGESEVGAYVVALQNVLESHFDMQIADEDRNSVIARVIRTQTATVGVNEGR